MRVGHVHMDTCWAHACAQRPLLCYCMLHKFNRLAIAIVETPCLHAVPMWACSLMSV